jgi:hypothetical protein
MIRDILTAIPWAKNCRKSPYFMGKKLWFPVTAVDFHDFPLNPIH